jgi:putative nucleotidyltransferase with HDIG domain
MIRSLALSLGVLDGFSSEKSTTGFDRDQLWLHCLAVGAGANNLVRSLNVQAGHIFITAFLHDIGKLVLDKFFPEEFKSCMEAAETRGIPGYEAEKEIIGMDHGEVGALLLEKWQFPDVIIEPVRQHHAGESSALLSREDLAIVRIMDALAAKTGFAQVKTRWKCRFMTVTLRCWA